MAFLPTPLHRLDRASADLGVDLFIKRDDLTGLALGGNKARKLEYLIADALAQKAQAIVTCGGVHSNFIRQLGAACAKFDLRCAAAVMDLPYEHAPLVTERLAPNQGNPILDKLLGVDLRLHPDGSWETLYKEAENLAQEYEAANLRVYRIPVGGSSPLGVYAFYQAANEIKQSGISFDWIVTASSSGSTQTGLTYAFADTETKVLGIAADPEPDLIEDFATLGQGLATLIPAPRTLKPADFLFNVDFVGDGYGIPSPEGQAAIEYLARTEGILLDPIYTAKAFAALRHLIKANQIGGKILFWHTGGTPSLFAYSESQASKSNKRPTPSRRLVRRSSKGEGGGRGR